MYFQRRSHRRLLQLRFILQIPYQNLARIRSTTYLGSGTRCWRRSAGDVLCRCPQYRRSKSEIYVQISKTLCQETKPWNYFHCSSASSTAVPETATVPPTSCYRRQQEVSLVMVRNGVLHPPRNARRKGIKIVLWSRAVTAASYVLASLRSRAWKLSNKRNQVSCFLCNND